MTTTAIDTMLTTARARLARLEPRDAQAATVAGAVLVDIRPELNRRTEGRIPGALVIDRNVLEWRLDPASDARIAAASYDAWIVLFCNEGYASSLGAAALQDLGIAGATDMVGGYRAWRALGLPVSCRPSAPARSARGAASGSRHRDVARIDPADGD
jgi:rhodanese-related sulfurtransferase